MRQGRRLTPSNPGRDAASPGPRPFEGADLIAAALLGGSDEPRPVVGGFAEVLDRPGIEDAKVPEVQVHVEVDDATLRRLHALRIHLEASSIGEVVRRAVQGHAATAPASRADPDVRTRTLHVRIPRGTKSLMDRSRLEGRASLSDVVRDAVAAMARDASRPSSNDT